MSVNHSLTETIRDSIRSSGMRQWSDARDQGLERRRMYPLASSAPLSDSFEAAP
jgi:hypothetical protein